MRRVPLARVPQARRPGRFFARADNRVWPLAVRLELIDRREYVVRLPVALDTAVILRASVERISPAPRRR